MKLARIKNLSVAPALDRGIDVIEYLASSEGPVSFSEILGSMEIPKASLARILNTLCRRGIVDKTEEDGHYRLGMKLLYLGNLLQDKLRLRSVAWPFMQKLADEISETVELSILDRDQLVLIEQIEGPEDIRVCSRVGGAYPYFHAVSVGKIYLAHMDSDKRKYVLKQVGLPAVTQWTITDLDDLEEELSRILKNGYASENQELRKGIRRVAAPIHDYQQHIVGCLSVAAPVPRLSVRHFGKLGKIVKQTASEISKRLGASGLR
jgi:DNA-binding IclR family transcriptional regulator